MDSESSSECNANDTIEITQNHRVHIVRVVYQNVTPAQLAADKERKKCTSRRNSDHEGNRSSPETQNDNWPCATCTVTPCRCMVTAQSHASKCSSCDSFIEAQQQQQEPGPVQLEYSCRCHKSDVTVLKTVCAKCATKIHELLADILVCERQDHCTGRQLSVNSTGNSTPDLVTDVCSNCQVVGSRIFNSRPINTTPSDNNSSSSSTNTGTSCIGSDVPPPLPKRKFITRGAVRTPPPPKKGHQIKTTSASQRRTSPPPKRRLQRTRSADSPSDSDSSLSDSSDYPNLQYKPGVVPNEYIESDDFPTSNTENVPFDLTSLNLSEPLGRHQYSSKAKSPCLAASNISPVNSSLSSMCASPASVSHSSPETVSSDEPKHSPMHTSVSLSINSSVNSSPITLLDNVPSYVGDCDRQVTTPDRRNYTIVEYHGSQAESGMSECTESTTGDLIDLRSPLACSPPMDLAVVGDFPIMLPEIEPPDFLSDSSSPVRGAEGGACTPASFDLDFIVACDEAGVPDLSHVDWPGSCEELTDDVFLETDKLVRTDSAKAYRQSHSDAVRCESVTEGVSSSMHSRAHRRTGSAGGRVDRADSPPPKLPLKPSLSLNQTPPPIPKRDFRPRERQIVSRPHRVARPHTFDPSSVEREKQTTQPSQDLNLPMADVETNRTISQLVFGAEQAIPADLAAKPQERPEPPSVSNIPVSNPNSAQRKKRPLSSLLNPKHTLNKIFHKKSSKESRDGAKASLPSAQRELPPLPVDSRNYCAAEQAESCVLVHATDDSESGILCDLPPPLLPREPLHTTRPPAELQQAVSAQQQHNFIDSLIKLREVGWYWGPLSMDKAEAKLADKKDGSFLVRDSSHDSYILSLSFRSQNRTHHTRIEFFHGTFGFWSQPSSHGRMSIVEFIEKAMEHSRNGKFLYFLRPHSPGQAPSPVVLLYPISRYERVQSLQHACRFVILKFVRYDHIDQLPLPSAIKLYLKDKHYFAEQNGDSSGE